MSVDLRELLAIGARAGASDVHITAGAAPLMRVDGDLVPITGHYDVLDEGWVRGAAFAKAGAKHVIFGHLHSVKAEWKGKAFPPVDGVEYHLASCDYLDFAPKFILEA